MIRTVFVSSGKETGAPITTKLTVDFGNLTEEDIVEYAMDSLIIKWRASIKGSKTRRFEAEDTYKAPRPGIRAQALSLDEQIKTLTPEQKVALIAKLTA